MTREEKIKVVEMTVLGRDLLNASKLAVKIVDALEDSEKTEKLTNKQSKYQIDSKSLYAVAIGNQDNIRGIVNDFIKEGWRPIGGVCVVRDIVSGGGVQFHFHQAMIRELPRELKNPETACRGCIGH